MIDAGLPVRAFFTTRDGGVSATPYDSLNVAVHVGDDEATVQENRRLVGVAAGAPVTFLTAEHGIRVARIEAPTASAPGADVLVTTTPGVALGAIAADCLPILLHDAATDAVAAVHVGRPGLFAGTIDAAWAALLDARPRRTRSPSIRAAIGPAICGRCYEVPADLRDQVAARHPVARSTTSWGTPSLDLGRAAEARLAELGALDIVRIPVCTREDDRLFSYRRDGVTGRHAGVIVHP